jgi:4-carboxymuconolactone decarboxylase
MSRIPYPDPATLSQAKRALLDDPDARILNISRFAMYASDAQWATQRAFGQANLHSLKLAPRLRELVILRVAHLSNSAYELHHHEPVAAGLGMDGAELAALRTGDYAVFGPLERAICEFVTEVVRDVSPRDETLAAIRALISDELMFEIVFLAGYYMIIARVAAIGGPELEAETLRLRA